QRLAISRQTRENGVAASLHIIEEPNKLLKFVRLTPQGGEWRHNNDRRFAQVRSEFRISDVALSQERLQFFADVKKREGLRRPRQVAAMKHRAVVLFFDHCSRSIP